MGTQKWAAQFKGKGGWAKGLADESRDWGTPLETKKKKGMREGFHPCQGKKSDMTYQPFCGGAPRDRACEQSDDATGAVWPNW